MTCFILSNSIGRRSNIRHEDCLVSFNSFFCGLLISSFLLYTVTTHAQEEHKVNDWENPSVIGINKEKAHATFILPSEKSTDPRVVSLNGLWRFKWSPNPESRPTDF